MFERWAALSGAVKIATAVGIVAGAIISSTTAWTLLGLPWFASKSHVENRLRPIVYRQLLTRRQLNGIDLFLWEQNNPPPRSHPIQSTIDRLKAENVELDEKIREHWR